MVFLTVTAEPFQERAANGMTARLLCTILHSRLAFGHTVRSDTDTKQLRELIDNVIKTVPSLSNTDNWCIITKENSPNSEAVFLIPLRGLPVLGVNNKVEVIDPEDFNFPVFHQQTGIWKKLQSPASTIMNSIHEWHPKYPKSRVQQIILELENSVEHQAHAYSLEGTKELPKLGDHSMVWEQSLIEGHPTHPMHKCRFGVPPMPHIPVHVDMLHPVINFVAVPRKDLRITGSFEKAIVPLRDILLNEHDPTTELVIPVHSYQVVNVTALFPEARILEYEERAEASLNLRTVQMKSLEEYHVKLSCGIILSGGIRTIGEYNCIVGKMLAEVVDRIVDDQELLIIAKEAGSVISSHPDPSIAKHLSCVIREDPEFLCRARGESVIVCAALIERDANQEFMVNKALGLNTETKRWNFFQKYTRLFLETMVPPVFKYGFCFESHPQNTMARFKKLENSEEFELVGFLYRDFDGIDYHIETIAVTTGIDLNDNKYARDMSIEKLHSYAFHGIFQSHLLRVVRALGFHYCGRGWNFVREVLDKMLPEFCPTRDLWLNTETIDIMSYIVMKLEDKVYDTVFTKAANYLLPEPAKNNNYYGVDNGYNNVNIISDSKC